MTTLIFVLFSVAISNISCGQDATQRKEVNWLNLELDHLLQIKKKIKNKENPFYASYLDLLTTADQALDSRPLSVMDKKVVPPSGDKHDYISLGPYWWPDPEKEDGLPWIRKDGEINPLTRGDNVDQPNKTTTFNNIYRLALADFYTDDSVYGAKAIELIQVWFLNEDTRMNPNLNYGQGIPGITSGRPFGIIEMQALVNVVDALELLEYQQRVSPSTVSGMKEWINEFHDWLEKSELGSQERERKNNHGSWYDVLRVSLLHYLDREEDFLHILEQAWKIRIDAHIDSRGMQPHEIARTKSLSYSTMNLKALTALAYFSKKQGLAIESKKEYQKLLNAYAFLKPFALEDAEWELPQLSSMKSALDRLRMLFYYAGDVLDQTQFCEVAETYSGNNDSQYLIRICE